ncbi:cupredoxin domain-containing protein [Alicyclobacillus dauci]|uniref:Cupredoxin domain-containing protein n=1 Tax=Alicyclobacillus dauci TaxID=1475485 RepID=A0ABY6Z7L1_9BACL|nr:cupredoxin domain-containing protein [Alicyclobacillus dauci]WAH38807.1 cupredoxin domain-containing protein [Alicyclobacillus dauci]
MSLKLRILQGVIGLTACATVGACSVPEAAAQARTVKIVIRDNGFAPNQVLGVIHQPIHLVIRNAGHRVHEFAIPEYRIYTRNLGPGETSDVEFSPWQAGSFVMYSDPEADSNPEFSGRFVVVDQK